MLRRDPCVAADPNGPAATLHGGARRRHVASCRAAQANHLPRAQLERSAAAPRARLRGRWAVERDGAAARQRLGAHPSPTGPAGTASSSHTALGSPWPAPPHASQPQGPELDRVLDLAKAEGPSRLPLRWLPPCGP